ncbi:secreted RxLR effector protein 161-like [Aristolochia californica]|uniref:secreted RxLR effector protein 161-like n=1 Tax=Aristolochia californica TaxID=171875 RepID=UPI0035E1C700
MDIDYAIRKDEPPTIIDTSTAAEITLYERWERSNHFSMMFIKTRIFAGIRGSVDQHEKVKDLLKAIDDQFVTLDKETCINKVLERFRMNDYSPSVAPIVKGDRFNFNQCSKNDLEREQMKGSPYASTIGSLMYVQICITPDITFAIGMLGRYQSNPGFDYWRIAKKVMRYLQGTKNYMLMYRRKDNLEVIGYSDFDFAGCIDSPKSTSGYIFLTTSGAISWKSAKQTLTATSSLEAELVSRFEDTSHGVWL